MKFVVLLLLLPLSAFAEFKFSNQSELSLIVTGGNSTVETYNVTTLSKWVGQEHSFSFGGHYTLGKSEQDDGNGGTTSVESARNWDVNGKYEKKISKKLNGFFGVIVEGDKFSGIDERRNYDAGVKYILTKNDKTNSFAEIGARYTEEFRTTKDANNEDEFEFTKGRLYYEINHKKSEALAMRFWLEYLPNFTESEDYIVTVEPSLAFLLSNTFSLKTAYRAIYDNLPNVAGNKKTDYTVTTSIIANF